MKAKDVLTILLLPVIIFIGVMGAFFYTAGEILEYYRGKKQ